MHKQIAADANMAQGSRWWRKTPVFRRTQYPDIRGDAIPRSVVFVKDPGTYPKVTPEPTGL